MNRCLTLEFVCSQQLFIKHSYILSVYQIPGIVVSDGDIIMSKEKKDVALISKHLESIECYVCGKKILNK